jgi:hypothetical protein
MSFPRLGISQKTSPPQAGQGAQKIIVGAIHELPLRVRRNGEVAAQSRSERDRWTFYETIKVGDKLLTRNPRFFNHAHLL